MKKKKQNKRGVGTKEIRKQEKQGKKPKNNKKKPKCGEGKITKKRGFHHMANEFDCPCQVHLALLDGNQNGLGHYCSMTTKTILVTIKFDCRCQIKIEKGGI